MICIKLHKHFLNLKFGLEFFKAFKTLSFFRGNFPALCSRRRENLLREVPCGGWTFRLQNEAVRLRPIF